MSLRRGFVLIAVLWIIIGASAFALGANVAARQALRGAANRSALLKGRWGAMACLERVRAVIDAALTYDTTAAVLTTSRARAITWRSLDRVPEHESLVGRGCEVTLQPAGRSLDVNSADAEMLQGMLAAFGTPRTTADSLVDALLDWRDPDELPREFGAEGDWYRAAGRPHTRNGPLQSKQELSLVRGFDVQGRLHELLDVETGRIALESAPPAVLAALPGLGPEAIGRIVELRQRDESVVDLVTLSSMLSTPARNLVLERYADLVRLTTLDPDAWLVRATGRVGEPAIAYTIELHIVRAGDRAAIVRRRSWIE